MTALYINGITIQMNEVAFIQFNLNNQNGSMPIVMIATNYEFLKQMHDGIGDCLKQRETSLNFIKAEGIGKGN